MAKKRDDLIEFDNSEISLILEVIKMRIDKIREDRFYRREHPEIFYDTYLERYYKIANKLDRKLPSKIFIKMPKL